MSIIRIAQALVVVGSVCPWIAQAQGSATAPPAPASPQSVAQAKAASGGRWTGRTMPNSSGAMVPGGATAMRGTATIEMTPIEDPNVTRITITFRGGRGTGSQNVVAWALLEGRCGSASMPVVPVAHFPLLQVGGSGNTSQTVELNFTFPRKGSYHVNLYPGDRPMALQHAGQAAVTGCGNLKFGN